MDYNHQAFLKKDGNPTQPLGMVTQGLILDWWIDSPYRSSQAGGGRYGYYPTWLFNIAMV